LCSELTFCTPDILEHELLPGTVEAFIDFYPAIKANGWEPKSIPQMLGTSYYLNSADNTAPVVALQVGAATSVDIPQVAVTSDAAAASATPSTIPSSASNRFSIPLGHLLGFGFATLFALAS